MSTTDHYRVLGVRFDASKQDIVASYRRLCKIYHPDINHAPGAEDMMKKINVAYYTLRDELRRAAYDATIPRPPFQKGFSSAHEKQAGAPKEAPPKSEDKLALLVLNDYFAALLQCEYEKAYSLLSAQDRAYVTVQSFVKWRKSVQKLFAMREYAVSGGEDILRFNLEAGVSVPAKKFFISILEKNQTTQTLERYQVTKFTLFERGMWRVFLGHRDLNEIARVFEDMSLEQEKGEMARRWEEYCKDTCRGLDMLSYHGLLKESKRELYRCQRYRQDMTIACFRLGFGFSSEERQAYLIETAAKTIVPSLRETDIAAYISEGYFIVLFVELKRRHAQAIVSRLAEKVKKSLEGTTVKGDAQLSYAHAPYDGGPLHSYIQRLKGRLQ